MPLIELSSATFPATGLGKGLREVNVAIYNGQVCTIETDSADDALLLLRALATMVPPMSGTVRYKGKVLDFADYRRLLSIRRKIGYVTPDAAMISNRTLRENLLLMRYYFEDSLSITFDPESEALCKALGIDEELDRRPADIHPTDLRLALLMRELGKSPELLLIDQPKNLLGHSRSKPLLSRIESLARSGTPVLCIGELNNLFKDFRHRRLRIENGALMEETGVTEKQSRDRGTSP